MARNKGRISAVVAGLGVGAAAGLAAGALVLAPNLAGESSGEPTGGLTAQRDEAQMEAKVAKAQAATADEFIKALSDQAVKGQLADKPMLILRAPGSTQEDYEAIKTLLKQAGAVDSGTITLEDAFFDQNGADGLKSIVTNTLPAGAQLSTDKLDAGTHSGEALAAALYLDEAGKEKATTADRAIILKALRQDKYISYEDGTILPAQGVFMLLGNDDNKDNGYRSNAEADFARAMRAKGGPFVVTGGIYTAADGAVLDKLRAKDSKDEVSTVDSIDRSWAKIAAILAMREQLDKGRGDYGAADSAEAASPAPAGSQRSAEASTSSEAPPASANPNL